MTEQRADYSKHTDAELRRGIAKAAHQDQRIAVESSTQALAAERDQRQGMAEELQRRKSASKFPALGGKSMKVLRQIPATLLAGASAVLSSGAKLAEKGAQALAPRATKPERAAEPEQAVTTEPAAPKPELPEPGDTIAVAPAPPAGHEAEPEAPAEPDIQQQPDTAEMEAAEEGETAEAAAPPHVPEAAAPPDVAEAAPAAAQPAETSRAEEERAAETPAAAEERPAPVDESGQARTYESHIAELADRSVASVVREIPDLSTQELGQLFEYESAHRKRKTVLQAIERAASPSDPNRREG